MNHHLISRRKFLQASSALAAASAAGCQSAFVRRSQSYRLATFSTDVTVPMGHALMGGGITPAKKVADPLFARGFVLTGGELPLVLVSVEWCEIRNDAFDRWRTVLAKAAGTQPERVMVTSTHVHDAPVADLEAQRILNEYNTGVSVTDLDFHEQAVQRVAAALREGLGNSRPVTHFGCGEARVNQVASNRRFVTGQGAISYARMSRATDPAVQAAPEGTIDPFLKTISFWNGSEPLLALHSYAVHPMSYYGQGEVSSDFPGLALQRRQAEEPGVFHIYASGCSGNVTAGKYNDGSPAARHALASRLHQAMAEAQSRTQRFRLDQLNWRSAALELTPRTTDGFAVADLIKLLSAKTATPFTSFQRCLAAMGLSWHRRVASGRKLDLPVFDFGAAQIVLLPAESYVEYQLFAQQARPDSFVLTMGYGECAPGYIPIEKAWQERDSNLRDWCWVAPGAESTLKEAIALALRAGRRV
jgi:hypothetical protein